MMRAEDRPRYRSVRRRCAAIAAVLIACGGLLPTAPRAQPSGLPVPRFVTLRADEANMRTGPGEQYPIKWIYQRSGLPLEIIGEYHHWRHVRDWQGTDGWMHGSMLTGRRSLIVIGTAQPLYARPDSGAPVVAEIEASVTGQLRRCPERSGWCEVQIGRFVGWMRRGAFWGVYETESVD